METAPYLAFDTETDIVDLSREVPRLAMMQVSNGRRHVLVHPDRLAQFIEAHSPIHLPAHWVGFNAQFDWWVVFDELERQRRHSVQTEWLRVLEDGRLHDAMLLDFLVCLAEDRADVPAPRGLGRVAKEVLGSDATDKQNPYRLRFGELIGKDWSQADPGFFAYAITDVIATWEIYHRLRSRAERVITKGKIDADVLSKYGPLTERLQVQASVVLAEIGRNGMGVDLERAATARDALASEVQGHAEFLRVYCPDIFDYYRTNTKFGKVGDLKTVKGTGVPKLQQAPLRNYLARKCHEVGLDEKRLPRTPKGDFLTTALDPWRALLPEDPLVVNWSSMCDKAKLLQFLVKLQEPAVYPSYRPMTRTGRTSCTKPNVQQMPRQPWFRSLFVPREGGLYAIVDYSAIELVTLASVCLDRFGRSVLAEQIRAGRDPHAYTASMVLKCSYDEVVAGLKAEKADPSLPKKYAPARQAAKALNFGIPGGLGPKKLSAYAKANYGVDMSEEEAKTLKKTITLDVYPELDLYLQDEWLCRAAGKLGVRPGELLGRLRAQFGSEQGMVYLCSKATSRDPGKLSPEFCTRVWETLGDCCQDHELKALCYDDGSMPPLSRHARRSHLLSSDVAITRTGRIRAGVLYTEARNTPFQGLAADGAKLALWRLWQQGFRIVAFVHDEIVCEVPKSTAEGDLKQIEAVMIGAMEEVVGNDLPVKVEGHLCDSWSK